MIEIGEDWMIHPTVLGEGAYGEVKLLIHKKTNRTIACKTIDYQQHANAKFNADKEVAIHRVLNHENIIKFYTRKCEIDRQHLYLEYAENGELFQMIEPGIGMPSSSAQAYMKQLLNGLKYIHSRGIAHRDIKPENLLINGDGVLKICDFGMATMFRCKGKERLLDKRCGTRAYLAPEVLIRNYHAEPADVWSCGIVLIAMLTGELPWHELDSDEFRKYKNGIYITLTPWSRLTNNTLNLSKKILCIDSKKRYTIQEIINHPWMNLDLDYDRTSDEGDGSIALKQWRSMLECDTNYTRENPDVTLSQPTATTRSTLSEMMSNLKTNREQIYFSQPVHNEDMIFNSQLTQSQITKENFHVLIKRLTRFYVKTNYEKTLEILCSVLNNCHYTWQIDVGGAVSISTVDSMKNQLNFKANIIEMEGKILLDFRLSRGCGLEFKKKFKKLRECLDNILDDQK